MSDMPREIRAYVSGLTGEPVWVDARRVPIVGTRYVRADIADEMLNFIKTVEKELKVEGAKHYEVSVMDVLAGCAEILISKAEGETRARINRYRTWPRKSKSRMP